jgi:hypothetical protein
MAITRFNINGSTQSQTRSASGAINTHAHRIPHRC